MDGPNTRICGRVPEHSPELLRSLGGGETFEIDGYLFNHDADWLMAIGYRTDGVTDPNRFDAALKQAVRHTNAVDVFAIASELPQRLSSFVLDKDDYYVLPSDTPVPPRLRSYVRRAKEVLAVDETRDFSAAHRRLWTEFLVKTPLPPRVRRLYAVTDRALRGPADLRLLNAWDAEGNLAACLVLDYTQPACVTYVIGAHSRRHYVPHAADLLFAEMLERARMENKDDILLGLGVNDGIRRFKLKWGGRTAMPYTFASWTEHGTDVRRAVDGFTKALLNMPIGLSKRQIFAMLPEQRPYAMLWRLEKNGKVSWIGGSAHFFCCSFEHAFRRIFEDVDVVLCEGPIDAESLAEEERYGRNPDPDTPRVGDNLTDEDILALEKTVRGPTGKLAHMLNFATRRPADVRDLLFKTRPWYAFFGLWTAFLERHGWTRSVDLEVWNTALDMGKSVIGMESMDEQLASLDSAPMGRIVHFIRGHRDWPRRMRNNRRAYLAGDLNAMMGTTAEFPTRTERIIGERDQRFRERMRPYLDAGGAAVFVGSAHMQNLRPMLAADGFTVTRVLPTWKHRLRAFILKDPDLVLTGNPDAQTFTRTESRRCDTVRTKEREESGGFGTADLRRLSEQALVPEQLTDYVTSVSNSALKAYGSFAGWVGNGSAVIIAYPVDGNPDEILERHYADRIRDAISSARRDVELRRLTILTPILPDFLKNTGPMEVDAWWSADLPHVPTQKLRNMIRRARREITIRRDSWSPAHAALVDGYLHTRSSLAPGTRHIFGHIEAYLQKSRNAVLFSGYGADGALAAFCVGDYTSLSTAFYMFAFRSPKAPPGTSDALLASLAEEADVRGFTTLNFGLGIDSGITFFKRKWGAKRLFDHYEITLTPRGRHEKA